MSDLIRREDVIKLVNQFVFGLCKEQNDEVRRTFNKYIEKMQTAYDIDKVVEELKENASRYTKKYVTPYGNNGYKDTKAISVNRAIEIVKQGSVSYDVCEWEPHRNNYVTSCEEDFVPMMRGYKYCPYCGKKIKVVEQMDEEEFCYCHYDYEDECHDCLDYMDCEECPYYYADLDQESD